jgi:peptidoglycan-associated lipoprotein
MKSTFTIFLGAAILAGCSSAVKLDDVPVVDRAGTSLQQGGTLGGGTGSGVGNGGVAPVDIGRSNNASAPPAGPRIVYFDHDSFIVKPEFQGLVETHAQHIKSLPKSNVAIEGHTDDTGGREYNLALGQKRAESVRNALSLLGVSDSQIEAVSYGKEKPAALGNDEVSRAKNRRAELSYR